MYDDVTLCMMMWHSSGNGCDRSPFKGTGLSAVVASSKDSDESPIMPIFEAAQASRDLVRADAERERVGAEKALRHLAYESGQHKALAFSY